MSREPVTFKKPKVRPHLRLDVVAPDLVVGRSEDGFSVLEGRLVPLLVPWVDGRHSVADIVARLDGEVTALDVRFGLSLMAEEGWLVEDGDEPPAEATVEVLALGSLDAADLCAALAAAGVAVEDGAGFLVVLTDDYLRPELAEVLRRERRPWMLVKPVGAVVWVGPVFHPPATGCWDCLAARLEANQPYRALGPVPAEALPAASALAVNAAAVQVPRWLRGEGALADRLVALDSRTLGSTVHVFVRRPACPSCGDPGAVREARPVVLAAGRRGRAVDGGFRLRPPDETFRRFAHHLSPITGLVGGLDDQSLAGDGAVARLVVADHVFRHDDRHKALRTGQRLRSAGKGTSAEQARASALCEALERTSGLFHGDEPRRRASFAALGDAAVHPASVLGYSAAQYAERERWNARGLDYAWVPMPFDEEREVDWTPLWSLTEERFKYLPTACCYFSAPLPDDHRFCRADSNGNAAGTSVEEALLQGFLELVERDAVAAWWANRPPLPGVDLASFERASFTSQEELYRSLGRELWVLDLTSDFGVPVFAAVSRAASAPEHLFGFGAHFDEEIAIARALTEVSQFLPSAVAGKKRRILSDPLQDDTFLEPDPEAPRRRRGHHPGTAERDLAALVGHLVELARRRGLETLVLDQTRPDVGLAVVKVVVPGMRHYWPRWAPGRLYDVPVELGWLPAPRREEELNPVHLLI